MKLARVKASGAVADEFRQSLPIPTRNPNGLRMCFFFCPALARPQQPVRLGPPHYSITLHADSGKLEELRSVKPSDYGQKHKADDEIGTFAMPEGLTFETFMSKLSELYQTCDVLLPPFARGATRVDDAVRQAARNYQRLFTLLSEPPWLPYYRSAGQEFLVWVDQTAR